jgi:hypothetical protein
MKISIMVSKRSKFTAYLPAQYHNTYVDNLTTPATAWIVNTGDGHIKHVTNVLLRFSVGGQGGEALSP